MLKAKLGEKVVKFSISNIKAISGFLGSASAIISIAIAIDAGKARKNIDSNPVAGILFAFKIFLAGWTTTAATITAFSYAAP